MPVPPLVSAPEIMVVSVPVLSTVEGVQVTVISVAAGCAVDVP
jgi:hypothetical protein